MLLNRCGSIMNSKLIVGKQSLVDVGVFGAETAYCDIALELVLGDVFLYARHEHYLTGVSP